MGVVNSSTTTRPPGRTTRAISARPRPDRRSCARRSRPWRRRRSRPRRAARARRPTRSAARRPRGLGLAACPREHRLGEVAAHHLSAGSDAPRELERQVAGAGGDIEHAAARADAGEVRRPLAPAVVQAGRHHACSAGHRPPRCGRTSPAPAPPRAFPRHGCHGCGHASYFSCDRKATTALNFCGGRFLNEGIGAVGFTSVRAIPWRGQSRADVRQFRPGAVVAVVADLVTGQTARLGDHRLAGFVFGERRSAGLRDGGRRGHFDRRRRAGVGALVGEKRHRADHDRCR